MKHWVTSLSIANKRCDLSLKKDRADGKTDGSGLQDEDHVTSQEQEPRQGLQSSSWLSTILRLQSLTREKGGRGKRGIGKKQFTDKSKS